MSYKPIKKPDDLRDVISRKEFMQYKTTNVQHRLQLHGFRLHAHQSFMTYYMNPNNPNAKRMLVNHDPGLGKTILTIGTAVNWIKYYKEMSALGIKDTPYVNIIGYTKGIFMREILRWPELGYISHEDIAEHAKLKKLARDGTQTDKKNLQYFENILKHRIITKSKGGYFRFFGYKELANNLVGDETEVNDFIKSFAGSLTVCDEIPHVYNSMSANIYGDALLRIIRYHETTPTPMMMMYLSGSPINHNATELVDLVRLLTTREEFERVTGVKEDADVRSHYKEVRAHLAELIRGKLSFLQDSNPAYFPTFSWNGVDVVVLAKPTKPLRYLKFQLCHASKHEIASMNAALEETGNLHLGEYGVMDLSYPQDKDGNYITRSHDLKKLEGVKGVNYRADEKIAVGDYLRNALDKHSAKYSAYVNNCISMLKGQEKYKGKRLSIHQDVHGTGVLEVAEILRLNGFLEYKATPGPNTLCYVCGEAYAKHNSVGSVRSANSNSSNTHSSDDFKPATFATMHGDMPPVSFDRNYDAFNLKSNAIGDQIYIMVGSRAINESKDFNCLREIDILSLPPDMPTLFQMKGRGYRRNAHLMLPSDRRTLSVKVYVTVYPVKSIRGERLVFSVDSGPQKGRYNSYELELYATKLTEFEEIKDVLTIMHELAVDAYINEDRNFPTGKKGAEAIELGLGAAYFKPKPETVPRKTISSATFSAFYQRDEVELVRQIIQTYRRFYGNVVEFKELSRFIRDPTSIQTHSDRSYIEDSSIWLALGEMDAMMLDSVGKANSANNKTILFFPVASDSVVIGIGQNARHLIGEPIPDHMFVMSNPAMPSSQKSYQAITYVDVAKEINNAADTYDSKKQKFFKLIRVNKAHDIVASLKFFETDFYVKLAENAIEYVSEFLLTTRVKSEYHDHYLKYLYALDKVGLLIHADALKDTKYWDLYKSHVTTQKMLVGYDAFAISVLSRNTKLFNLQEFDNAIKWKPDAPKPKDTKVPAYILPVGHFLDSNGIGTQLKLFGLDRKTSNPWTVADLPLYKNSTVENDTIIGYYEKEPNAVSVYFKLRPPIHKMTKGMDLRMRERGGACDAKPKHELEEIAKSLDVAIGPGKIKVKFLCRAIEAELTKRELNERAKSTGIRWMYQHFETQPT